jgi:hypothetical protein
MEKSRISLKEASMDRRTRSPKALGLPWFSSTRSRRKGPLFADLIQRGDMAYRGKGMLRTKGEILAKRRDLQASVFEEFAQDPEGFTRRVPEKDRHFLFDAVVDGRVQMRVGRPADGGKWICDPQMLAAGAVVYSFGVGDEISFDLDMAGLFGCQVYMFDPTPRVAGRFSPQESGYPCGAGRLFYHPIGLGPVSTKKGREWDLVIKGRACEAKSLLDIARSLQHSRVDLLKVDSEGGEYASLHEILSSGALAALEVKMILVEFHFWSRGLFGDFVGLVAALAQEDYWLYRKEFNPRNIACAEYAFVKSSFLDKGRDPD